MNFRPVKSDRSRNAGSGTYHLTEAPLDVGAATVVAALCGVRCDPKVPTMTELGRPCLQCLRDRAEATPNPDPDPADDPFAGLNPID